MHILHPHSPFRIFGVSALATVAVLVGAAIGKGPSGTLVALVLIAIEIAFSFDNAILNARILSKMSRFWQSMFLTVGALIAVFGMRIVFPILIVALTANIGWHEVLNLALHHPSEYAEKLHAAHPAIASFGGAFLMMLALDFFADNTHQVLWLTRFERQFSKLARNWAPPLITGALVAIIALLPFNHRSKTTLIAGVVGVIVYSVIHGVTELMGKLENKQASGKVKAGGQTGMLALVSFLYLEILDASFSFDGVIGAFVVTQDVILIALGLGVGALWVRSLTIFMVRRGTLGRYIYVEHGAHYTIGLLALLLFASLFLEVPEVIAGLAGISIIVASVVASRQAIAAGRVKP